MLSRAALTGVALAAAELMGLWLAVRVLGVAPVVAVLVLSGLLGAAVLRRQLASLIRSGPAGLSVVVPFPADPEPARPAHGGLRFLAGVLLCLPGLLSSVAGALLLVPPVRSAVAGWFRRRWSWPNLLPFASVPANGRSPHRRDGDVVDVDVVAEDMPTSARPELH